MARCIQAFILCVCLIDSTIADELANQAQTPSGSPFQATEPESLEWPREFIEYEGRATISAKYRFVFDAESGYPQNPHLFLMPDPESRSKLPYLTRWVNGDAAKKVTLTETAEKIWVTNVADAALALLGSQLAEEVLAGKHKKVIGEAVVVIEGFTAGYSCDSPFFGTQFVEVSREILPPSKAAQGIGGC
jgi:hypothetical protein